MNKFFQIIIFLMAVSTAACTSTQSNMTTAGNDEDRDVGLGGTGMLAGSGDGSGMGGTGIVGEITGFGSVFVNGIEIEYDSKTAFTVDGKSAAPYKLEIGDVVEVLTTDANDHTQARVINLRHEIIGKVESVEPQTFSFTVHGQSIVQAVHKAELPEVGTSVAVSGFRIDEQTILSTRVSPADVGQSLLRKYTDLPFAGKTARWIVQTHVRNETAVFKLEGVSQLIQLKHKTTRTLSERLGIKILKLQKQASGQLELEQVMETAGLPRGRKTRAPVKSPGSSVMPGSTPGSKPGKLPGSTQGGQSGSMQNMKR